MGYVLRMAETHQITARLSEDGYNGLTSYCAAQGVSVTAYIDSLGQWFLDYQNGTEGASSAAGRAMVRVVEHARLIDAERRSRTNRTPLTVVAVSGVLFAAAAAAGVVLF